MTRLLPVGPGSPFELLYSRTGEVSSLPREFLDAYPAGFEVQTRVGRPFIYSNFALSRDGRSTFNDPLMHGGADVTNADSADLWLMAFLRCRADAVMIGARTAFLDSHLRWGPEDVFPADAQAFRQLRECEGRRDSPLLVVVTHDGRINTAGAALHRPDLPVVIATTRRGLARLAKSDLGDQVHVHSFGRRAVRMTDLTSLLYHNYEIRSLLCEGGAHVLGSLFRERLVDEEFITWCPIIAGSPDRRGPHRPGYIEGVAFYNNAHRCQGPDRSSARETSSTCGARSSILDPSSAL